MTPTESGRVLLNRLNQVNRDMGLPEMGEFDPVRRGAADISFVAKGVDGLAGLGLAGSGTHSPEKGSTSNPFIFRQIAPRS